MSPDLPKIGVCSSHRRQQQTVPRCLSHKQLMSAERSRLLHEAIFTTVLLRLILPFCGVHSVAVHACNWKVCNCSSHPCADPSPADRRRPYSCQRHCLLPAATAAAALYPRSNAILSVGWHVLDTVPGPCRHRRHRLQSAPRSVPCPPWKIPWVGLGFIQLL